MPSTLLDSDRLDPRTYHPDLQEVVEQAYRQGIRLTPFPALLRMSQFKTVEKAVTYIKDCSEVRSGEACEPCVKNGRPCLAHNGSSIRCLPCYILEEKADCTHQTKMENRGHSAAPKCFKYDVAAELGLIPVPDEFQWKSKRVQMKLKRALRGSGIAVTGDVEEKDDAVEMTDVAHETEQPANADAKEGDGVTEPAEQPTHVDAEAEDQAAQDAEQPSATADAKGKQRADRAAAVTPQVAALSRSNSDDENVDQLADDDPPKPTKARKSSPRKKTNNGDTTASPRKKTDSGDTAILEELRSMVQHLVQNSDEMLLNSRETLRLQRLRYEALSSDSESEPLAKRRRTDESQTAATSHVASLAVHENAAAGPSRAAIQQNAVAGPSRAAVRHNAAAGPSRAAVRHNAAAGPSRAAVRHNAVAGPSRLAS